LLNTDYRLLITNYRLPLRASAIRAKVRLPIIMPGFSKDFIERVRNANPIETVIGERVQLKKAGKNWKGLCPFHNEKTPSFSVSSDKGFFKCFGCGKGGNVFSFLMEYEGVSFPEAVEELANKAGLPVENLGGGTAGVQFAAQRRQKKDRLFSLCKFAEIFFIKSLHSNSGVKAKEYIKSRGITEDVERAFRLGYAPDSWDSLCNAALKKGYSNDELVLVGLAVKNNEGTSVYDRFRNRLIFPVWDLSGNVIAFGGRALGDDTPKYLNSPATPLYVKSKVLYPIFHTKRAIQKKGTAVLCEGYMDAITLSQFRFTYVVASCGTALTSEQARLLKRFTEKVVVAYDGDSAGQDATIKSISVLVEQGIDVFIAGLSGGEDPDSFLKTQGRDKFNELLDNKIPFFTYLLNELKKNYDSDTPQGKRQLCEKVFPLLSKFDDTMVRGGYIDELAAFIHADRDRIERALNEFAAKESRKEKYKNSRREGKNDIIKLDIAEETLIAAILSNNEAVKYASENLDVQNIDNRVAHRLIQRIYNECQEGEWRGLAAFLDETDDDEAKLITGIISRAPEGTEDKWRLIIEDCKNTLYNKSYSSEINKLRELLLNESDEAKRRDLQTQIHSLQKEKRRHSRIKKHNIKPTT